MGTSRGAGEGAGEVGLDVETFGSLLRRACQLAFISGIGKQNRIDALHSKQSF